LRVRRIFVPEKEKVTTGWRKLHNNLYFSSNINGVINSRMKRMGHIAFMGGMKNARKILIGVPDRKRLLEKPICGSEDNIKMDLKEIVC
jgi:hypothetical protein